MPHVILEYSSNIIEKENILDLFKNIHELLVERLPTELSNCKSRAAECKIYSLGNGDINNAFVHVNLKIMAGRAPETLESIGKKLMSVLKEYFALSGQKLALQISLEIEELQKTYFKTP